MLTVSFCTTCMGRRDHLAQTLPRNLARLAPYGRGAELVLLDYNSPDGLEGWVRERHAGAIASGALCYLRTTEPRYFHAAHAKNVAHRAAGGDLLFNLDADNLVTEGLVEFLRETFGRDGRTIGQGDPGRSTAGRICVRREDFLALRGYDERFRGWGREDGNFVRRAVAERGLAVVSLRAYDGCLEHPDEDRVRHLDPATFRADEAQLAGLDAREQALYARLKGRDPRLAASWLTNAALKGTARDPGAAFGVARLRRNFVDDVVL